MAILRNDAKQPLFSVEERVAMIRECTSEYRRTSRSISFRRAAGGLCERPSGDAVF